MKKFLSLAAMVLVSACCLAATNKNVSKARNLCESENADFAAARVAIQEAIADPEAAKDPNTFFVAGLIGYKEFSQEKIKMQIGQNADIVKAGAAIEESLEYWKQAYQLTLEPIGYDKKGQPKYDTKTMKQITPKVLEYYQSGVLTSSGFSAYEQHDYTKAFKQFMDHIQMPELEMLKDDAKSLSQMVIDSGYYTCIYYAGRFAYEGKQYEDAIATLRLMNSEKAQSIALRKEIIFANEYVYQCYIDQKDTANAVAALQYGIDTFKEEPWFMQSLINLYINSNQVEKAIDYLDLAIQREPGVGQYYNSKASILSRLGRFDESFEVFKKALELEPSNALFQESLGFAYVDLGNKLNDDAAYLDAKAYAKAKVAIDAAFNNALPYFQKAYELEPSNEDYKRALRQLYYRLGKYDEYKALED